MLELRKMDMKGYGYEVNNPIKAMITYGSYGYLNSLKAKDGTVVRYDRVGTTISEITKHIVDIYHIFVLHTEESIELRRYELYIDMYNRYTDTEYPEGFEK